MQINIVKPFLPTIEEIAPGLAQCLNTGLVTNNSQNVIKFEESLVH